MGKKFSKIGIIGTGMMGGSLALALMETTVVEVVCCYDVSRRTREKALELGVGNEVVDTPAMAAEGSDAVFLATPVGKLVEVALEVSGYLKRGAILTDLGSTKLRVTESIEKNIPDGVFYIGGHPMTGSEQSGVSGARADLYRDCYYILTPTRKTDPDAFSRLHYLLGEIGSRVISMNPEAHDRAVAMVSHVPHLLSLLLINEASGEQEKMKSIFTVAAGGFRDMTRISASNPDLWIDILMDNKKFISQLLGEYASGIDELIEAMEKGDRAKLKELFEVAGKARARLGTKPGHELMELYEVTLPVADEPGIISEISTTIGSLGVNIEDIGIVHPLEGEKGILSLKIAGGESAVEVARVLDSMGYRVGVRKL